MLRKKYTEEQIIAVLKEAEAVAKLPELCRKFGMSEATYYNWKAKYSGMTAGVCCRMK
jgi:putative transposase